MLRKPTVALLCSVAIGFFGLLSAQRAEAKDPETNGGIAGKVVAVDATKGTVTIADANNRERTYSITDETVIVGPRGGVVHSRLKDHRFHSGLPITVVAEGSTATQLHLGYDRKARGTGATSRTPVTTSRPSNESPSATDSTPSTTPSAQTPSSSPAPPATTRTSRFRGLGESKRAAKDTAKSEEEEDEDSEFPGKVKSFDPARRVLVVSLVNGKDRSFLLASDVKVLVNSRVSRRGLNDPALQSGAALTVVTETGGRKVKEVKVSTATKSRVKKAA